MGTQVHLVAVDADPVVLELGRQRIHELEALWSRFREDSEISRLNLAAPRPVRVSPETIELVQRSLEGWQATSGAFDPTILGDLVALGYHASFEHLRENSPLPLPSRRRGEAGRVGQRAPGCGHGGGRQGLVGGGPRQGHILAGPSAGIALLQQARATGLLLDDNRRLIAAPGMEAFLQ